MLLETTRGCVFKCKFCYYPKSYDKQYYLSREQVLAGLRHAAERGAREVFLLDPTLNQRKDFADFLRHAGGGQPRRPFHLLRRAARGGNQRRDGPAAARGEFHGGRGRLAVHRAGDDDEDGPQEQPAGLRARRAGDARPGHPREGRSDRRPARRHRRVGAPRPALPARQRLSPTCRCSTSRCCRARRSARRRPSSA